MILEFFPSSSRGGGRPLRGQVLPPLFLLLLLLLVFATVAHGQPLLRQLQQQQDEDKNDEICSVDLENQCNQCNFVCSTDTTTNDQPTAKQYNCSLPGLQDFAPGGQYEGIQANYLSFVTDVSTPFFPDRAIEFEACTGGKIDFSDAQNIFQDPVQDLGTISDRGSEVYDGYFMSYSHFPEVSALKLAEPLNDRIRQDNSRLKWSDVFSKVKSMGEYRHADGQGKALEFLMYDGDFFVPVIRLDLLEKHNLPLPNSWEEVVEYVQFFNGTDLNDDGIADDFGFCHFPRLGAGYWDWWWSEALYATWASTDQTQGTNEGFFFNSQTMEPRIATGFQYAAQIWKQLWNRGATSEATYFLEGRCAIGFGPPGGWKKLFLTPHGVHREDANGTVIWQPTMANGDYAEPYRFKPFGSLKVVDRTTGQLTDCNPKLCPKAEPVPLRGHLSDDDRASVLPPSPLAGKLINRAPFYWSGGLGTLIRKSAPKPQKDLLWDFFVYTNSPQTSVFDVANYGSWLDSWRYSQLVPGDNFRQAGWSEDSYQEHAAVMQWALSKEVNGAFNIRLPSTARYTRDVAGQYTKQFIDGIITLDELLVKVYQGWNDITLEEGKLEQLAVYRSSLGLEQLTEVEMCRLHRELMDQKDPSICRKYDDTTSNEGTILLAVLIPVGVLFIAMLIFVHLERKRRRDTDLVWKIDPDELRFDDPPKILGKGSFGFVLKAEYRGTEVAVKRFVADTNSSERLGGQPPKTTQSTANKSDDTNEHINKSFAHMVSEAAPPATLIDSNAVTPTGMGQTMSAKKSRAMVEMVKNEGDPARNSNNKKNNNHNNNKQKRRSSFLSPGFGGSNMDNELAAEFVEEMKTLATLRHQCVITIMGAVLVKGNSMIVLEYMDHGSLYDVLHNETMVLEGEIILPILRDIASGIRFLHAATPQIIHCDLKSANILVDGRFRAKVADFGLSTVDPTKSGPVGTPYFLAPEILRGESGNTVESDAYAFGIVIYEVYSRKEPYWGEHPMEVLKGVANKVLNKRPPAPPAAPPKAQTLMAECLVGDPRWRPTFEELDLRLKRLDITTMEPVPQGDPNNKPEQALRSYDFFPKDIADALREGRKVEPQSRDNCTIFSSQICRFDEIAARSTSMKMADLLHRLYSKFDELCGIHDIYKVETVNDTFMAIAGLTKDQADHTKRIAEFSLQALRAAKDTLIDEEDPSKGYISIRAGFASGNVVASVVGTMHPRYSLFGNAVTIASRMEQSSEVNSIQCSEKSAILLREQAPSFHVTPRGLMNIKGRGEMFTFFVDEEQDIEANRDVFWRSPSANNQ